jgi:hypothetical protein
LRSSNLLIFPRLLDGTPGYRCSGGTPAEAGRVPFALTTWLVGVLVIAALGLVWSVSERLLTEMMLVCLPAGVFAAFYLLLPGFTALRFLLPAFALLSLPVAFALVHAMRRWRRTAAVIIVAAVVGHVAPMLLMADRQMDASWRRRSVQVQAAAAPSLSSTSNPVWSSPTRRARWLSISAAMPRNPERRSINPDV